MRLKNFNHAVSSNLKQFICCHRRIASLMVWNEQMARELENRYCLSLECQAYGLLKCQHNSMHKDIMVHILLSLHLLPFSRKFNIKKKSSWKEELNPNSDFSEMFITQGYAHFGKIWKNRFFISALK